MNMLGPPNFPGTLLVSIPIDSSRFQLNLGDSRKMFILCSFRSFHEPGVCFALLNGQRCQYTCPSTIPDRFKASTSRNTATNGWFQIGHKWFQNLNYSGTKVETLPLSPLWTCQVHQTSQGHFWHQYQSIPVGFSSFQGILEKSSFCVHFVHSMNQGYVLNF